MRFGARARRSARFAASVLVLGAVLPGTSVAHAGEGEGACQAGPGYGDARIRKVDQPYKGKGVHNCNGANQTVTQRIGPGQKAAFDVRVKNDSASAADVGVYGAQVAGNAARFRLRVLRPDKGDKDVTDKLGGSGILYQQVPAGASTPRLRIVLEATASAQQGDEFVLQVGGNVGGAPGQFTDQVRARARVPA